MTKAVAIMIMAVFAACGQPPGAAQPGAAVPSAERPITTIGETIATVFVPGIGLVPAHEANTYLVEPGCEH